MLKKLQQAVTMFKPQKNHIYRTTLTFQPSFLIASTCVSINKGWGLVIQKFNNSYFGNAAVGEVRSVENKMTEWPAAWVCDRTHWGYRPAPRSSRGSPASSSRPRSNDAPAPAGEALWSHAALACRQADCGRCCGEPLTPAPGPPYCLWSSLGFRKMLLSICDNTHTSTTQRVEDGGGSSLPSKSESLSFPWSSWMRRGRQPDWRMAMQESWELDMARSVRDMSSLSCVPNIDRRL